MSRRTLKFLVTTACVGGLVAAVTTSAAGSDHAGLTGEVPVVVDAYDEFVDRAATEFDVSTEAARSRLEYERAFAVLVNEVARNKGSGYVSSALDGDFADRQGVIYVESVDATGPLVEEMMAPMASSMEVRESPLSHDEIGSLYEAARRTVEAAGDLSVNAIAWSPHRDQLTVQIDDEHREVAPEQLEVIASALTGLVTSVRVTSGHDDTHQTGFHCSNSPDVTGGWVEAGRLLDACGVGHGSTRVCTAGFAVRERLNSSVVGILTASHCNRFDGNTNDWFELTYANHNNPFSTLRWADQVPWDVGDVAFYRRWYTSATPYGRIYLHGQTWEDVGGWQWENPEGQTVAAKGARTAVDIGHLNAVMIGTIVDNLVDVQTNHTDPDTNFRYAAVDYGDYHSPHPNLSNSPWEASPREGDSGSAVYIPNGSADAIAIGVHKGGDPTFEYYSKIGYALNNMDLVLVP